MTDYHLAIISAAGIFFCFLLAILAYFLNFSDLARLSVFFACFNLLPLGKLDGSRIFFGSRLLYTSLVLIALIALVYVFLVP
jgi:Zn-dependent protease